MSLPETYRALVSQGKGQNPIVKELPVPKPGKNQVLVKMEFSPLNPSDIGVMKGTYRMDTKHEILLVGFEGSGTVAAVGEDLNIPHKVGDRVHVQGLGTIGQYLLTISEE